MDGVEAAEVAADGARLEQLEAAAVDLVAGEDLLLGEVDDARVSRERAVGAVGLDAAGVVAAVAGREDLGAPDGASVLPRPAVGGIGQRLDRPRRERPATRLEPSCPSRLPVGNDSRRH